MLEEVQALSLREVGIPSGSSNSLEPPRERRRRERSRDTSRESRRSRDERRSRSRQSARSPTRVVLPPRAIEHQSSLRSLLSSSEIDSEEVDEELVRQVLEELVSEGVDLSQIGPSQEEEITERIAEAVRRRQSERHAERQRERRERRERLAREGLTSSSSTSLNQPLRSPLGREDDIARRRAHGRSESGTSTPQNPSGPPISRPGLIDAANRGGRNQHVRSSSQGSSRSARRAERPAALSVSSARPSNLDVDRPSTSGEVAPTRRRQSDQGQRSTVEARQQFRNSLQTAIPQNNSSMRGLGLNMPTNDSPTSSLAIIGTPGQSPSSSTPAITPFQPPGSRRTTDPTGRPRRSSNHNTPPTTSAPLFPRSTTDPSTSESRSRQPSTTIPSPPTLYSEPHITCHHCGKDHIEHELHYNCPKCDSGNFNICLRCYRSGKGCKHWFGFGWTAMARWERLHSSSSSPPEHPHVLTGHRYRLPSSPLTESMTPPHVLMSEDPPANRLEKGVFCAMCKAFSNKCYWNCEVCNEGEWGFCNECVVSSRCCTHPLLPLSCTTPIPPVPSSSTSTDPTTTTTAPSTTTTTTPSTSTPTTQQHPQQQAPSPGREISLASLPFTPLPILTLCNICTSPIPPSQSRYHCPKCNAGDYDMCTSCYHRLNLSGRIAPENGLSGWRRCVRGHRMLVVGYAPAAEEEAFGRGRGWGWRRVVVREVVGGWGVDDSAAGASSQRDRDGGNGGRKGMGMSMGEKEFKWRSPDGTLQHYKVPSSHSSHSSSYSASSSSYPAPTRFPPDGGTGLRLVARWSYWPDEGVQDELGFPRGAEIREAVDINGDWYFGVYCGRGGLLPAGFVVGV